MRLLELKNCNRCYGRLQQPQTQPQSLLWKYDHSIHHNYIDMQVAICSRGKMTDTHSPMPTLDRVRKQHFGARLSYLHERFPYLHTQVAVQQHPLLIACTNTQTPRDAFLFHTYMSVPLHACSVTRNSHICFTSVGWVFLVETVALHSVLWDIRACRACFLVHILVAAGTIIYFFSIFVKKYTLNRSKEFDI